MGELARLPRTTERIAEWVDDTVDQAGGAQMYVSRYGEVFSHAFGRQRPGTAMTERSVLRWYCAAKPWTSIAIHQLVSKGEMALDDAIGRFVPEFAENGKANVTVRHVLTHTAGLHIYRGPRIYHSTEEAVLNAIYQSPLPSGWLPGRQAAYSELVGWQVLGQLVERVAGLPLGLYLRQNVFGPMGLEESWLGMTLAEYEECQPWLGVNRLLLDPMGSAKGMWYETTEPACTRTVAGFGGYATARDFGRFYEALLDPGHEETDVVDPGLLRAFTSTQRSGLFDLVLDRICDYGFGFMVNLSEHHFGDYCSPSSFGHSGLLGASLAFADPSYGLVVALIFNDILDPQASFLRRKATINAIYKDLGVGSDPEGQRNERDRATSTPRFRWSRRAAAARRS